ncbi:RDD family protein [Clostridium tertium]|uniref:RDD family protein n=1 Tax=Clostridium TaxID=1485 RepID=UPI0018AAA6B8|nr:MULTISPECIES: RDD family protein [Clostridium]MBS5884745.1 RDD family protein [Clostridium sp.]MDB1921494.1 RDD family protein [Clostridium tertium]MDB1924738.1 RDD family protein [Clostridium tertium]MDB1928266.1 RDD family protein [Clostridium tertium]MDB1970305.1 RDD family protein [Clostridium tertium]
MVDREDAGMDNGEELVNNEVINNEELNKDIEVTEEDNAINEEVKEDGKAVKFIKRLLAATIDQIVAIAFALLLLLVFDFLLKFVGFYIAQRQPMFLVIYVITNILYSTICESTKLGRTIGKKTMLK